MVKSDGSDKQHDTEVELVAREVFSSEKREDIWAIIIAVGIFFLSTAFPEQIHNFFTKVLFLF
ncbi:MAG: hypothetical protein GXP15_00015 [Gammaproteobacteria bacterium]|nr:hypothetical protein [Gammaproteobacteria bacterium]